MKSVRGPALQASFAYVCVRRAIDESLGSTPKPPHHYLAELGLDERTLYRRCGQFIGNDLIKVKGLECLTTKLMFKTSERYKCDIQRLAGQFKVKASFADEGEKIRVTLEGSCETVLKVLMKIPYTYVYLDTPTYNCFKGLNEICWEVTEKGLETLSTLFNREFNSWDEFRKYISEEVRYASRGLATIISSIDSHIHQLVSGTAPRIRSRDEIIAGAAAVELLKERLPVPAVVIVMDEDPVIEKLRSLGLWKRLNQLIIPPLISAGRDYFLRTVLYRYAVGDPKQLRMIINQLPLRVFKDVLPRSDLIRRLKALEKAGDIKLLNNEEEVEVIAREPPEAAIYPSSPLAIEKAVNDRLYISISHRVLGLTRIKYGKDAGGGVSGTIAVVYDTIARIPLPLELLKASKPYDEWKKNIECFAPDTALSRAVEDDRRGRAIYTMLGKIRPLIEGMIEANMLIKTDLGNEVIVASRSMIPTTLAAMYDRNVKVAREVVSALLFIKYRHGIEVTTKDIGNALKKLGLPPNDVIRAMRDNNLIYDVGDGKYLVASDYRNAFIDYMERALGLPAKFRIIKSAAAYIDRLYRNNSEAKRMIVNLLASLVKNKPYTIDEPKAVLTMIPILRLLRAEVLIEIEPSSFDEIAIEGKVTVRPYSGKDVENYRSVIQTLWHSIAIGLGVGDIEPDIDYTNDKLAREILKDISAIARELIEARRKVKYEDVR